MLAKFAKISSLKVVSVSISCMYLRTGACISTGMFSAF
jgi:hypothetical protein